MADPRPGNISSSTWRPATPPGARTSFGAWNVHGGMEYQALGKTTQAFNGGDGSKIIGSVGIRFSY